MDISETTRNFFVCDWKFICSSARFCSFRECLTVFIPSILLHLKKKKKWPRVSTLKEEEDTILYSFAVVSDETKGGSLPQSIF